MGEHPHLLAWAIDVDGEQRLVLVPEGLLCSVSGPPRMNAHPSRVDGGRYGHDQGNDTEGHRHDRTIPRHENRNAEGPPRSKLEAM